MTRPKKELMKILSLTLLASAALAATLFGASSASGGPPSGAVRGSFSIGLLASGDELSQYITGSDVWCAWRGTHVVVHVTLKNSSVETISATVKPRYTIARGSEHGTSFLGAKDYTLKGGQSRPLTIDAGRPAGTPSGARIATCSPYLYLVGH
jgi:hypothetical protein